MGIFDEAIREHLDLKRRQGVDEGELKELEDEAFGLPARPGDEPALATDEGSAEPQPQPSEPTPVEAEVAAPAAEPPAVEEEPEAVPEPHDEEAPHGDALLEEEGAAPPEPPAEEPVPDEGARFSTTEREAIADKPTEFFDQAPAELELGELDLDLDEEIEEAGSAEEPVTGEEPIQPEAPAQEPDEPEPAAEPEPEEPAAEAGPEAEADEADDVLEETPEFLRENPDDDELWFEQGKPKDFDF